MSSGKAFVFGDDIDTDMLAPGQYMTAPIDVLASHCLEAIAPEFASQVKPGDVIFAGENFGIGSSREQAAQALKHLGITAIVARSFGGIFYRNAINLGLAVFEATDELDILPGEPVSLDTALAVVTFDKRQKTLQLKPLPGFLLDIVESGGLVAQLEKRFTDKRPGKKKITAGDHD